MTGITGDMRSGGATSEERGEKKHVVCGHDLPTDPGVRNIERKNELLGIKVGVTMKTKQLEVTGVQQWCGRTGRKKNRES